MKVITATLIVLAAITPTSALASVKCETCDATQGNCNTGTCEGAWCIALITDNKATKTRSVHKDCASANPTGGKDDGCVKDTTAEGETYRCGCNSADGCNSEANVARMQAMLNNQFSLPGAGAATGPGAGPGAPTGTGTGPETGVAVGSAAGPGAPTGTSSGAAAFPSNTQINGQQSQVPPGLINPNSTFTDVLTNQPTPFPGQSQPNKPGQQQIQPGQPQPGLIQPGQPQPGPNPGAPSQPNTNNPNGGQPSPAFPSNNNQPFPQGGSNIPQSPNSNKPAGPRPGHETETGFAPLPGGLPPNTNSVDVHAGHMGTNESSRIVDNRSQPPTNDLNGPPSGQSRAATNTRSGAKTCACTEPACNGPCKGEVCYMMAFSANDVHNQAFAGKQGQIIQSGCTDDASVLAEGSHHAQRQIPNYKFKINGQDITVPASATYCNDGDFCNGASAIVSKSLAIIAGISLAMVFLMRF